MTVAPPRPIRLLSTRKVLHPARAASIAAYMPAPPDPMIRTSVSTWMDSAALGVMAGIIAAPSPPFHPHGLQWHRYGVDCWKSTACVGACAAARSNGHDTALVGNALSKRER